MNRSAKDNLLIKEKNVLFLQNIASKESCNINPNKTKPVLVTGLSQSPLRHRVCKVVRAFSETFEGTENTSRFTRVLLINFSWPSRTETTGENEPYKTSSVTVALPNQSMVVKTGREGGEGE